VRNCGGTQTGSSGTILSPNFPNNYNNNAICEWLIAAPLGTTLQLNVTSFDTEFYTDVVWIMAPATCEVYTSYYGKMIPGYTNIIGNNTVGVIFVSDSSITCRGFNITWRAI
jgi:uncharacterized membrane protein YcfT